MARDFEGIQTTLALNLRKIREERGLSQEDLALEADIDRTYVSQIERAACNPSLRVLHQLADVLGIQVNSLLQEPRSPR